MSEDNKKNISGSNNNLNGKNYSANKINVEEKDDSKKRFVDYDFIVKKEKYNRKSKEIVNEEMIKSNNRLAKNEKKLFILTIVVMLIIVILSYFLIMKSMTKNDLKNIVEKDATDQVIEKVLEAKRKLTADEYVLEKELIETSGNIATLNASISKKDDKSINVDQERVEKIEEGVRSEIEKKEEIRNKIAESKKNSDASYDGYVEEIYMIYLDKENHCVYTNYILKTANPKLFEEEKNRISESEMYSNVVVNNVDLEKENKEEQKENLNEKETMSVSANISKYENKKIADILNDINKKVRTTKFELLYNSVETEKKK